MPRWWGGAPRCTHNSRGSCARAGHRHGCRGGGKGFPLPPRHHRGRGCARRLNRLLRNACRKGKCHCLLWFVCVCVLLNLGLRVGVRAAQRARTRAATPIAVGTAVAAGPELSNSSRCCRHSTRRSRSPSRSKAEAPQATEAGSRPNDATTDGLTARRNGLAAPSRCAHQRALTTATTANSSASPAAFGHDCMSPRHRMRQC